MRNTTTSVVIAAGLVLAAVIVSRTPAQQEYGGLAGVCCLPSGGCRDDLGIDGCSSNGGTFLGEGSTCAGSQCPSVAPPTVVSVSVSKDEMGSTGLVPSFRIFRSWSDGQVDMTYARFLFTATPELCDIEFQCGPAVVIPGTCPTDINRDGDTGIQDFLTLLGGWGACQ